MPKQRVSGVRRLLDDGVSLSALFNAGLGGFAHDASDRLNSRQSESEQAKSGQAKSGQVSAIGLRPYTLQEKLQNLKRMIAKGKIALSARVSFEMLKHELKKPENDGLGMQQMVSLLKDKKLLQTPKAPKAAFKLKALAPGL